MRLSRAHVRELLDHLGRRRRANGCVLDRSDERPARLAERMLSPNGVSENRRVDDDHRKRS
jgi:hypothetical protein